MTSGEPAAPLRGNSQLGLHELLPNHPSTDCPPTPLGRPGRPWWWGAVGFLMQGEGHKLPSWPWHQCEPPHRLPKPLLVEEHLVPLCTQVGNSIWGDSQGWREGDWQDMGHRLLQALATLQLDPSRPSCQGSSRAGWEWPPRWGNTTPRVQKLRASGLWESKILMWHKSRGYTDGVYNTLSPAMCTVCATNRERTGNTLRPGS